MAKVCCWDSSFHSEACVALWLTREEVADSEAMIVLLRERLPEMEAALLAYRETILEKEQIEAFVVRSALVVES